MNGTRILQVITDDDRRGAQVFATDLQDEWQRSGREVRTVALARGATRGLDVPVLGERRLGVATLRALRREFTNAGVVIAHGSTTLPACALAGAGTGVPFIYRQISDSRFWAPSGLRRLRVRAGLARAERVVALWAGSADTLHQHFGVAHDRIRVIPNGVPPSRFPPADRAARDVDRRAFGLDPGMPTAVCAGALVPEKGVDLVVAALASIRGMQLLVVGDGPERNRLEHRARTEAPGRVVFAGSVQNTADAYAVADVVVLASRGGDSMPAVLIEAGLMGVPAVSTPVEGIPEIVVPGVTGELAPVGSVAGLASALRAVVDDPVRAHSLGEHARARCLERFAIGPVAVAWSDLVDQVLGVRS